MFNFKEKYKNYSNVDLLKIIKRPEGYQADAVKAATELLEERQVLHEEQQLVDDIFDNIENSEKQKKEKIESIKAQAQDFFEPIIKPSKKFELDKWWRILLLIFGAQTLSVLYFHATVIIDYFQCDDCEFDLILLISILSIPYLIILFYLLLKKKRLGWILLFVDNFYTFLLSLSNVYIFFRYQNLHLGDTFWFLFSIIFRGGFTYFLWQNKISSFFGVSKKTKINAFRIAVLLMIIIIIIGYIER